MPPLPMPVPTHDRDTRQRESQRNRQRDSQNKELQEKATSEPQQPVKMDNNLNILFNQSKDEMFSLTNGYKKFQRELKNYKILNCS